MINYNLLEKGSKVRVRSYKDLNKEYIHCGFNDEMTRYCGKVLTIRSYTKDYHGVEGLARIFFFEDEKPLYYWTWTNQMVELVSTTKIKKCLNKI